MRLRFPAILLAVKSGNIGSGGGLPAFHFGRRLNNT